MQFRLKLRRRPHSGIAPTGDGPWDDLIRGDAVSCSKDSTHTSLMEGRFRLNVSHRTRGESQLLDKRPGRHSEWLMN